MLRRFKPLDWFIVAAVAVFAIFSNGLYALLALIVLLLYLLLRRASGAFRSKTSGNVSEDSDEFIVHESNEHGVKDIQTIHADRNIDYRHAPGRFRHRGRFDLEGGDSEYEYRCEGTKILFRLLNQRHRGESTHFNEEWAVRDGVVLESDLRDRWDAKEFKFGSIDDDVADLKKQVEWRELEPAWFNGFKYVLIKRCLPPDDARRYLRQEVERLKIGYAKAVPVAASKYAIEPDPDPTSIGGWRRIPGREDIDTEPFWQEVETGVYGVSKMECGSYGLKLVADLHRLLGDAAPNSKD